MENIKNHQTSETVSTLNDSSAQEIHMTMSTLPNKKKKSKKKPNDQEENQNLESQFDRILIFLLHRVVKEEILPFNQQRAIEDRDFQLIQLTEEKFSLQSLIEEKDEQLLQLSEAVLSLKDELAAVENNDWHQAAKDIAKRNRDLSVQIAKDRGTIEKLKKENDELKFKQTQTDQIMSSQSENLMLESELSADATLLSAAIREAREWQDKYDISTSKLVDLRNQLAVLKSEKDKLVNFFKREVGEEHSIQDIIKGKSEWKGRAEQITILKKKIKDLRDDLKQSQPIISDSLASTHTSDVFEQQAQHVESLKRIRQQDFDQLTKENQELKDQFSKMRLKLSGALAREGTNQKEIDNLKQKIKIILDKSFNDDQLVSALRQENEKLLKNNEIVSKRSTVNRQSEMKLLDDLKNASSIIKEKDQQLQLQAKLVSQLKYQIDSHKEHALASSNIENQNILKSWQNADHSYQQSIQLLKKAIEEKNQQNNLLHQQLEETEKKLIESIEEKVCVVNQIEAIQKTQKVKIPKIKTKTEDTLISLKNAFIETLTFKEEQLKICYDIYQNEEMKFETIAKESHQNFLNHIRMQP